MCGRYALYDDGPLDEHFGLDARSYVRTGYNIAPAQSVSIIRNRSDSDRDCGLVIWGWQFKRANQQRLVINARSETITIRSAFKAAFRHQRCLVPANLFYEWMSSQGKKYPYAIRLRNQRLFAFAGIWRRVECMQGPADSCVIITTDANDLINGIHNRMPVIVPERAYDKWLDPAEDITALQGLLKPYPHDKMEMYPVSTRVNSAKNDDPACIAAIADMEPA